MYRRRRGLDRRGIRQEAELRDEERITEERIEQQDVNQGMDTGTHSSVHRGVGWSAEYRLKPDNEKIFPTKQQIEARAYELYEQRGREDGYDLDDWLVAEKELKQQ